MTNYEKIKSMSLDEMAEFIVNNFENDKSEKKLRQMRAWLEKQCIQYPEITNYGNLRSLSLDDMAITLDGTFNICKMCPYLDEHGYCDEAVDMDCTDALRDWFRTKALRDWLQTESKGGTPYVN